MSEPIDIQALRKIATDFANCEQHIDDVLAWPVKLDTPAAAALRALPALLDAAEECAALKARLAALAEVADAAALDYGSRKGRIIPAMERLGVASAAAKANLASRASSDIAAERFKQIAKWGNDHDDEHADGMLAAEAALLLASYVDTLHPHTGFRVHVDGIPQDTDPWRLIAKTPDQRERLVVAGALIAAEIDRTDRAAAKAAP